MLREKERRRFFVDIVIVIEEKDGRNGRGMQLNPFLDELKSIR